MSFLVRACHGKSDPPKIDPGGSNFSGKSDLRNQNFQSPRSLLPGKTDIVLFAVKSAGTVDRNILLQYDSSPQVPLSLC